MHLLYPRVGRLSLEYKSQVQRRKTVVDPGTRSGTDVGGLSDVVEITSGEDL